MIYNEQYEINSDINKHVKCDIINRRSTEDKVLERVKGIQKKQKERFESLRKSKSKVFFLKTGDTVLRKNNKNIGRKGGKLDPLWHGIYKIIDIDSRRRITIKDIKKDVI